MLLGQYIEIRRTRPAELALIGPGSAPGTPGLEVVGTLPPVLRAEHSAFVLESLVQGAGAAWPAPLVGVEWVAQVVVVAVGLPGQLGGITVAAMPGAKPPRAGRVGGELARARPD